jgi:hypothetical protein
MAEMPHDTPHSRHEHERRDVNVRWLAYSGVALVVLLIGSLALMWGLFGIFDSERRRVDTPTPLADTRPLPPGPRLQASPAQDMQELLATEHGLLQDYAWVDPSTGIVRIPIEQAMTVVVQQGLPDWRQVPAAPRGQEGTSREAGGTEGQQQGAPKGGGGS